MMGDWKMDIAEWKDFTKSIFAGIFGGIVVAGWQLAYEVLGGENGFIRGTLSALFTLIFLTLMILLLRFLFLKKNEHNIDLTNGMTSSEILRGHPDWERIVRIKEKHLDSLMNFSKKFFFVILAFLGAVLIALINNISFFYSIKDGWIIFTFLFLTI